MELKGRRIVIFADNMYQEMELWYPLYRFQEAGAEVVIAAAKADQTYTSKLGYPATSQVAYDDLRPSDFDGLIIPGGFAPDYMRRSPAATRFVKAMDEAGKLIAAICHGPWLLCSAHGMLKGRRVTSFLSIKDDMVNAGANWVDTEVVVDQNLVTSRKPDDLPVFCRSCISVLQHAPVSA